MPEVQRTADEIAKIYQTAQHSVDLINAQTSKQEYDDSDQKWKDRIKRNWLHLEKIKAYKEYDLRHQLPSEYTPITLNSIWTTEDFTAIDAAIVKGKAVQP